jgi:uncharacterized protein YneR
MTKKKFIEILSLKEKDNLKLFLRQYGPYRYQQTVYTCIILKDKTQEIEIKSIKCYKSEERPNTELIKFNNWMDIFFGAL